MALEACLLNIKIADETARYDDMFGFINNFIKLKKASDFSEEERSLIFQAYKQFICQKRSAYKIISNIEKKEINKGSNKLSIISSYKKLICDEIDQYCQEIVVNIENLFLKSIINNEDKAFYMKLRADHLRYRTEIITKDSNPQLIVITEEAYKLAKEFSDERLPMSHPLRLGIDLNYAIFFSTILKNKDKAFLIAKSAYEKGIEGKKQLHNTQVNEFEEIMNLLLEFINSSTSNESLKNI